MTRSCFFLEERKETEGLEGRKERGREGEEELKLLGERQEEKNRTSREKEREGGTGEGKDGTRNRGTEVEVGRKETSNWRKGEKTRGGLGEGRKEGKK